MADQPPAAQADALALGTRGGTMRHAPVAGEPRGLAWLPYLLIAALTITNLLSQIQVARLRENRSQVMRDASRVLDVNQQLIAAHERLLAADIKLKQVCDQIQAQNNHLIAMIGQE